MWVCVVCVCVWCVCGVCVVCVGVCVGWVCVWGVCVCGVCGVWVCVVCVWVSVGCVCVCVWCVCGVCVVCVCGCVVCGCGCGCGCGVSNRRGIILHSVKLAECTCNVRADYYFCCYKVYLYMRTNIIYKGKVYVTRKQVTREYSACSVCS